VSEIEREKEQGTLCCGNLAFSSRFITSYLQRLKGKELDKQPRQQAKLLWLPPLRDPDSENTCYIVQNTIVSFVDNLSIARIHLFLIRKAEPISIKLSHHVLRSLRCRIFYATDHTSARKEVRVPITFVLEHLLDRKSRQ
jgi:hypothetical protein